VTEFPDTELRHFCRNTKCRSKLKRPVSNKREAFCARGCHTAFYRKRCLVCEGPLQRRNETQRVCRKSQCRKAWRARAGFGRYCPSNSVSLASKTPNFIGSKSALKSNRAWRQIAGPKLSRSQLQWALVGAQEVAAENHQKNRAGWPKHNAQALLQPHHPPINIVGGYKFPNAPDVKLREEKEPGFALTASSTAPDDNLDIPDFLKR
jgi:hypothetical protein